MGSETDARVRVCLTTRELEVSGSQQFIDRYQPVIDELVAQLSAASRPVEEPPPSPGTAPVAVAPGDTADAFPEALHSLPKRSTDTDRMLLAGWHAQHASTDNAFSTGEANKLLVEQGIKVSNPSQMLKNSLIAKRVFKVAGRYRVSKQGEDYLRGLAGS